MKKYLILIALFLLSGNAFAAVELDADSNGGVDIDKGGTNAVTAAAARTALGVPATASTLVGDCTVGPCLDGTADGGNLIKLWAGTGSYWTALQGGAPAANRSWRLPIAAAPDAGTTRLMNMDEYGQMGFVAPNLTSFVDQTAWRVFYADGSGDVKELALGSDGTYLKSNGASSAPTFDTPSGSGDMVLATSQSVTGLKTFDKDKAAMKGTSTGVNTISVANTSATSYTNILPAKDGTFAMTTGNAFVGGVLSDFKIIDTAEPIDGSVWVDDTLAYEATDDHLHLWSISKIGSLLAAKQDTVTRPVTGPSSATEGHLAVFGASGQVIADGGAPPTGTLPSQTGNDGKYLTTDGTDASWSTVSGFNPTIQAGDPTAASAVGMYMATGSGHTFYRAASNLFDVSAGTQTPLYTLTITQPTHGNIASSDSDLSQAINCGTSGSVCTAQVLSGGELTGITATADNGYSFTSWGGDISGSAYNDGAVTMSAAKAGSVTFTSSAPTLSSRVIGTDGETLTLTGSESLSVGAGGNGGFDVDCSTAGNGITATYASGAPGTALVYTLGTTVNSGDTCDLDYTQPGNGIEATSGGADLASITSGAVTNNSTQSSYVFSEDVNSGSIPSGWTDGGGAVWDVTDPNFGQTYSVSASNVTSPDFSATSDAYVAFVMQFDQLPSGTDSTVILRTTSGVELAALYVRSTGALQFDTQQSSGGVVVEDTPIYIQIRIVKGTGSDGIADMWHSTTGASGTWTHSITQKTDGAWTGDTISLKLVNGGVGATHYYAKIRVSGSHIDY